jgi:hypothetical protein
LEMTHCDAVWCRADTGSVRVSLLVEEWTG